MVYELNCIVDTSGSFKNSKRLDVYRNIVASLVPDFRFPEKDWRLDIHRNIVVSLAGVEVCGKAFVFTACVAVHSFNTLQNSKRFLF